MFNECPTCRRWRDTERQQETCPHPLKAEHRMAQRSPGELAAAQAFIGKQVWFNPKRDRIHTVQACDHTGMLSLDGIRGDVAPYWVVLA